MAQIDMKNAVVTIADGTTPTPNSVTIKFGEGNLSYTEARTMEYTLDRGVLDEVREGDEVPMDVSFDGVWEYITGGTGTGAVATIEDALKKVGAAASWVSTDTDACRPYAVDLVITYTPTCGGATSETITLPDFRYESIEHDLRNGTIAFSGKCNAKVAVAVRA